jgi:ABC-type lipoprotein export system ATPase subunit
MEKYPVHDVFTPTTPARLTFVERETINARLVNALRTPGKQIVVYGYSGSGKTTLLVNKLHQLYDKHITSRCMEGTR